MIKKEFVTELSFLEAIEELEVVEITQLANHLGMKYDAVAKRLYRYTKSVLVQYISDTLPPFGNTIIDATIPFSVTLIMSQFPPLTG